MSLMQTSGMVVRRLGRIVMAVVGAYVLWIMLATLAPSAEAARIAWFALVFTGLVALSRLESHDRDETPRSHINGEGTGGTTSEDVSRDRE